MSTWPAPGCSTCCGGPRESAGPDPGHRLQPRPGTDPPPAGPGIPGRRRARADRAGHPVRDPRRGRAGGAGGDRRDRCDLRGLRLGRYSRGQDHDSAADLLETVDLPDATLVEKLRKVLAAKDLAHYSARLIAKRDAQSMVKNAAALVHAAERL